MYRIIISNFQNQQLIFLKNLLFLLLLNGQVSAGKGAKAYEVKEKVVGRIAEGRESYND